MQLARGNEGEEIRGRVCMVIASTKQPVFASYRNRSNRSLSGIVFESQTRVIEESFQRRFLSKSVTECFSDQASSLLFRRFFSYSLEAASQKLRRQ
jgi:hypothetical protein